MNGLRRSLNRRSLKVSINIRLYDDLNVAYRRMTGKDIRIDGEGNYKAVVAALLEEAGLNYGALPAARFSNPQQIRRFAPPLEDIGRRCCTPEEQW